ncbi:MAG TPA: ATP-dependent chaperone ClpB, partial [Thermoanaerobacterales bacterium]|nr:ATP-dependent chaperone ClpB [Thermoanaerobacterales bacterium]
EPLGPKHMEKISELLLKRFAQRIMDSLGLKLTWSEKTINYLAHKGYDPSFGARPVKRLIQQSIETPLSRRIIQGIKPGASINLDELINN